MNIIISKDLLKNLYDKKEWKRYLKPNKKKIQIVYERRYI
jgi:hypothetical protein